MFKWLKKLKKIKCMFKSGCCVNIEIDNSDGNLDEVDYDSTTNTVKIH